MNPTYRYGTSKRLPMRNLNKYFQTKVSDFCADDSGAQVVEYALIIAVCSISLVVALEALTTGANYSSFIARINSCLSAGPCL